MSFECHADWAQMSLRPVPDPPNDLEAWILGRLRDRGGMTVRQLKRATKTKRGPETTVGEILRTALRMERNGWVRLESSEEGVHRWMIKNGV